MSIKDSEHKQEESEIKSEVSFGNDKSDSHSNRNFANV